jgi:hypothetical protein
MIIAFFGSYSQNYYDGGNKFDGTLEEFQNACICIGEKIAESGHSVIISNYDNRYGDYYLVNGILNRYQKEKKGHTKIYINSPINYQNRELNSKRNEKDYKDLFHNFPNRQNNWINQFFYK